MRLILLLFGGFLDRLALCALVTAGFAAVGMFAVVADRHPQLATATPLLPAAALLLPALPWLAALTALAAVTWVLVEGRRQGRWLRIAIAGRDPRLLLLPIPLAGLLAAPLLWWSVAEAGPRAATRLRTEAGAIPTGAGLALFLDLAAGANPRLAAAHDRIGPDGIQGLRLAWDEGSRFTALLAARASATTAATPGWIRLDLQQVRIAAVRVDGITEMDAAADRLAIDLPGGLLAGGGESLPPRLDRVQDSRLDALPDDTLSRLRRGEGEGRADAARTARTFAAIPALRCWRVMAALLPAVALAVVLLAAGRDGRPWRCACGVGLALTLALAPLLVLGNRIIDGALVSPWPVLAPAAAALAAACLVGLAPARFPRT
jgi:hypothetical protein